MSNTNWSDKQEVLMAVQQDGYALQYASKELKNNDNIVLAAVSQNGYFLQFASEELKNDKEVVLAASNEIPLALIHASENLQNDVELLILLSYYHLDNDMNDYSKEYQTWFKERMTVLNILNEQDLLNDIIPTNIGKAKTRKF